MLRRLRFRCMFLVSKLAICFVVVCRVVLVGSVGWLLVDPSADSFAVVFGMMFLNPVLDFLV